MGEYEYIHRNPVEIQVKILGDHAPAIERPYIKMALGYVGKIEEGDAKDEKVGRVFALAREFSRIGGPKFMDPPGAIILSSEAFKKISPRLISLRRKIFLKEDAPFLNRPLSAIAFYQTWLTFQIARFLDKNSKISDLRPTGTNPELLISLLSKRDADIDLLVNVIEFRKGAKPKWAFKDHHQAEKLFKAIDGSARLARKFIDVDRRQSRDISKETFADDFGMDLRFGFLKGTRLDMLLKTTRVLANSSPFSRAALVLYFLTDIKPIALGYMIHQEKHKVTIELYQPLSKKDAENIYVQTKRLFKIPGKILTDKHLKIYDLVGKHGGMPRTNKMEFWQKVLEEWNRVYLKDKFKSSDGLRKSYQRILQKASVRTPIKEQADI